MEKKKQQLIHNAKVKKAYAKIRERELGASQPTRRRTRGDREGRGQAGDSVQGNKESAAALGGEDAETSEDDDLETAELGNVLARDDHASASEDGEQDSHEDQDVTDEELIGSDRPPAQASQSTKTKPSEHTSATQNRPSEDNNNAHEKEEEEEIHPDRQAMLSNEGQLVNPNEVEVRAAHPSIDADANPDPRSSSGRGPGERFEPSASRRGRGNRPGYYDKQLAQATKRKAEADERQREFQRRKEERERKVKERERFRRAVGKARKEGKDGKRKLGRESALMLEKAKRLMGQQ